MRNYAIILMAILLSGCAVGNKHDYTSHIPQFIMQGSGTAAVVVQDERPYVLNHDKDPDFVGLSRGGFGNPFDVTTVSSNPLAADFRQTIVSALNNRGVRAEAVVTELALSRADAVRALIASDRDRLLQLVITEWKSDTMMSTALVYDLTLTIYDKAGTALGENRISGRDNLGGSAFNPPAHAKEAVPLAFQAKLETLLNDPKIVAAMQLSPST